MTLTSKRRGLAGLVAGAGLVVLLALTTPVFAGRSGRRGAPKGDLALTITPSTSRHAPALPAASSRQPSQRAGRNGRAAGAVTLEIVPSGKRAPAPKPGAERGAPAPKRPPTAAPIVVTAARLRAIAAASPHPVYWAGPADVTYELTIGSGAAYVRYLPPGAPGGGAQRYLTVATYVRPSPPYQSALRAAQAAGATLTALGHDAVLIQYRSQPRTASLVFPKVRYEVSVYDPAPGGALRLAASGKVVPVR